MMMRLPPRPVRADRGREPVPSEGGRELQFGVFGIADPGVPEQAMVEGRAHERAAVVGVLARECLRVADTDDSACGIMAEDEGRECNRGADRLEAAWRHRDNEALDLTL